MIFVCWAELLGKLEKEPSLFNLGTLLAILTFLLNVGAQAAKCFEMKDAFAAVPVTGSECCSLVSIGVSSPRISLYGFSPVLSLSLS